MEASSELPLRLTFRTQETRVKGYAVLGTVQQNPHLVYGRAISDNDPFLAGKPWAS
jgi:hypothetical protein